MQGSWAQKLIVHLYLGPMTQAEDKDLSKEEKSSSEEIVLINKKLVLVIMAQESVPRMNASSVR